jgi:hypothetical protein
VEEKAWNGLGKNVVLNGGRYLGGLFNNLFLLEDLGFPEVDPHLLKTK